MFGCTDYTEKEIDLFEACGFNEKIRNAVGPARLYSMAAEWAFLEEIDDWRSDSLRRCLRAFNTGTLYRKTPEFESLIEKNNMVTKEEFQ